MAPASDDHRQGFQSLGDLGIGKQFNLGIAVAVYDALIHSGRQYGILPAGMDALDVSRVEAGFIMNGVDYFSAHHCLTEERKSSPFELGLGWTVQLKHPRPFIGREALSKEKTDGPNRSLVGLDISWEEIEKVFAGYGLPPECAGYGTPYKGLFLGGSGSHPGGGITCAPGALAARTILGS